MRTRENVIVLNGVTLLGKKKATKKQSEWQTKPGEWQAKPSDQNNARKSDKKLIN